MGQLRTDAKRTMQVLGKDVVVDAARKHPEASGRLHAWVTAVEQAVWGSIVDAKQTWPSADFVKDKGAQFTTLNVMGGNYRLIAVVDYEKKLVIVHHVFTHAEYTRWLD